MGMIMKFGVLFLKEEKHLKLISWFPIHEQ